MRHSVKGYREGCRCPLCKALQASRVHRQRAARQGERWTERAIDVAALDLMEVLRALAVNPEWTGNVSESVPGEIEALRDLIRKCNEDGRTPRVHLWFHDGSTWIGGYQ